MNRPSPDWALWRSFGAVVEHGSLSAAARKLGLSQPTVGRHIEALETSLGANLFTRTIKGLEPHASAMRLFDQVQTASLALNEATMLAEGASTDLDGTVRITASTITSNYLLPKMLVQIRNKYPDIQIELVPSDSAENLLMREADIAIRMFRPTQLELIARKICESPLSCCAHKSYLEEFGSPTSIPDLYTHEMVGFDRSEILTTIAKRLGFTLNRTDFSLRTDSQTAIWELVKAGWGIGFSQDILIDQTPDMEKLLPELKLPPLEIWLTTHKELFTSTRIRVIYDLLGSLLRECFANNSSSLNKKAN